MPVNRCGPDTLKRGPSLVNRPGIFDFDLSLVNPSGFSAAVVDRGIAALAYDGLDWALADGLSPLGTIDSRGPLDPGKLSELRRHRAVQIDWASHSGGNDALRIVAAMAAAGVPLVSLGTVPGWASPLGEVLGEPPRPGPRRPDERSAPAGAPQCSPAAVRTGGARPGDWTDAAPATAAHACTCRPEFVASALASVRRQRYPNLEAVLLLHGVRRDHPAVRQALAQADMPVTVREVPARTVFGDALNIGVEAASGEYVTKIDDDDWYGPNHVGDLLTAHAYADAAVVGSFTEFVQLEMLDLTIYRPAGGGEKYTKFVAGGTITAARETLLDLGGFPPVPNGIDVGLFFHSVSEAGGRIYRTHGMEYVLSRRMLGHTWDVEVGYFLKTSERQWFKTPGERTRRRRLARPLPQPVRKASDDRPRRRP